MTQHSRKAEELRRAFDRSFAHPAATARATVDLMLIRVADQVYGVRLAEVAAIRADAKITSCPSRVAAFSGVAGIRGAMVAVWDLALLLGHGAGGTTRWLFMPTAAPLAFRFDDFERHRRADADAIKHASRSEAGSHMRDMLEDGASVFPIIDIASIVATIRASGKTVGGQGG